MIAIEPRDNQRPEVVVHGEVTVDVGATEILSPAVLSVNDSDTLVVVIVGGPKHGYLEVRDRSGERKCSFLYFFVFRQVLIILCVENLHTIKHTHMTAAAAELILFSEREDGRYKKEYKEGKNCVFSLCLLN
jgi:hypothetical protein